MPQISSKKRDKISEQLMAHLFSSSPEPQYPASIAQELARDEEFVRSLLEDLEKRKLVIRVTKSPSGEDFIRRTRWRLSNQAFDVYKRMQPSRI